MRLFSIGKYLGFSTIIAVIALNSCKSNRSASSQKKLDEAIFANIDSVVDLPEIEFSDFYNEGHRPIDDFGKRFFDDWMEKIINKDTFNVAYKSTYTTFLFISQLDEADNVTYTIDVEDAFPRSMNLMELNNAAQNQTHRLTVLFAYRKWRRIDAGTPGEAETTQQISLNQQISQGFLT